MDRVLVVDNDEHSQLVMEVGLGAVQVAVLAVSTPKEAKAELEDGKFNLILTEAHFEGEEDFAFGKYLRNNDNTKHIPLIFITRLKSVADKINGLELGAEEYFTKPIYLREFVTRVKTFLKKMELKNLSRGELKEQYKGKLSQNLVHDILRSMIEENRCGYLKLTRDELVGEIYFDNKKMREAIAGRSVGLEAARRLLFWERGTFEINFVEHEYMNIETDFSAELFKSGLLAKRRLEELSFLDSKLKGIELADLLPFSDTVKNPSGKSLLAWLSETDDRMKLENPAGMQRDYLHQLVELYLEKTNRSKLLNINQVSEAKFEQAANGGDNTLQTEHNSLTEPDDKDLVAPPDPAHEFKLLQQETNKTKQDQTDKKTKESKSQKETSTLEVADVSDVADVLAISENTPPLKETPALEEATVSDVADVLSKNDPDKKEGNEKNAIQKPASDLSDFVQDPWVDFEDDDSHPDTKNKKTLLIIVAILFLGVLCAGYFIFANNLTDSQEVSDTKVLQRADITPVKQVATKKNTSKAVQNAVKKVQEKPATRKFVQVQTKNKPVLQEKPETKINTKIETKAKPTPKQKAKPPVKNIAPKKINPTKKDAPKAETNGNPFNKLLKTGRTEFLAGRLNKALGHLKGAIQLMPQNALGHLYLGECYLELGNGKLAKKHLKLSAKLKKTNAKAWALLGAVNQMLGNKSEAKAAYQQYLILKPSGQTSDEVRAILKNM